MSLFGKLFGRKERARFLSDQAHADNLRVQHEGSRQVLDELRKHGVSAEDLRALDFFFYTQSQWKGAALGVSLEARGYEAIIERQNEGGQKLYLVSGRTTPMPLDEASVLRWTEDMCNLGFEEDAIFDGWGVPVEEPDPGD